MRDGIIGFAIGLAVCAFPMWFRDSGQLAEISALKDTLALAKTARTTAIESVTVYAPVVEAARRESEAAGRGVTIVDATTLSVKLTPSAAPELVKVPAMVTRKMRADSLLIARQQQLIGYLYAVVREDSNVILRQDSLITKLESKRRCGAKCGAAITLGMLIIIDQTPRLMDRLFPRNLRLEAPRTARELRDEPVGVMLGHPIRPLQLP